jgi:FkbM family methyltransferase
MHSAIAATLKLFLNAEKASLSRKILSVFGNNIEGIITRSNQGLFAVNVEDMVVGRELLRTGCYGEEEIERALKFVQKDSSVLIIGAHIGALAIPLSRHCKRVTAIEANPDTFKLLESNILLNKASNIEALNIAASDKTETLQFVMNRANSGGSKRMPKIKHNFYFSDSPQVVDVQAVSLDELLGPRHFDLVIMDIEGSEYFALKGMQKILQSANSLFIEFLPHHLKNVAGVTVTELLNYINPNFEYLFVPSKSRRTNRQEFIATLQCMYDAGDGDEGLVFSKREVL